MRLSVAMPDSALSDESTKLDKSRKVSQMARCMAVFGIRTVFVYRDGDNSADRSLLVTTLRYLETPQFLRRRLFPKMSNLKFAGALHPLNIPSHASSADPKSIKNGDIREGIAVTIKGTRYADVGINKMIRLPRRGKDGRITVKFRSGYPDFDLVLIDRDKVSQYWGYTVRERSGIQQLVREWPSGVIITTRDGKIATKARISKYVEDDRDILVVFGSPERGVREIAGGRLSGHDMIHLNFFPRQRTRTVRLEEAMMGTLSILNMYGEELC